METRREYFWLRTMNRMSIRCKLVILYMVCIMIPLFALDGLFLHSLAKIEHDKQNEDMRSAAEDLKKEIVELLVHTEERSNKIYINRRLYEFLERDYESDLSYYMEKKKVFDNTFFEESFASAGYHVVLCSDNPTIINGGVVRRLDGTEDWYQKLVNSGRRSILVFEYTGGNGSAIPTTRTATFVRRLDYYRMMEREKVVRIDLNYNLFLDMLSGGYEELPVYVCSEGRILFSNRRNVGYYHDFEEISEELDEGYKSEFEMFGNTFQIMVMRPEESLVARTLYKNRYTLLFLLTFSILIPLAAIRMINRSFTERIRELSMAFRGGDKQGELLEVENVRGRDEIGYLMESYNELVRENRNLIKTIYEDRIHKQEMELEKKNAELLALRMQVNPHFLFNMLDNIRMHSLLNRESRTAEMIEKLAVLERQAVDWTTDLVTVREELRFVENYLSLQKFRFGDRFSYSIDLEEDCGEQCIPKMTITTFVENACVHGTQNKLSGTRIFVTVGRTEDGNLGIEIEDTSGGMTEEKASEIREQMENCTIDMLRNSRHTGMINACLRLKMMTNGRVRFELESDEGVGTYIQLLVPMESSGTERTDLR